MCTIGTEEIASPSSDVLQAIIAKLTQFWQFCFWAVVRIECGWIWASHYLWIVPCPHTKLEIRHRPTPQWHQVGHSLSKILICKPLSSFACSLHLQDICWRQHLSELEDDEQCIAMRHPAQAPCIVNSRLSFLGVCPSQECGLQIYVNRKMTLKTIVSYFAIADIWLICKPSPADHRLWSCCIYLRR